MPCTLHLHGESLAITEDAGSVTVAITNNIKLITVTRQSDGLKMPLAPASVSYVVPQTVSTATP